MEIGLPSRMFCDNCGVRMRIYYSGCSQSWVIACLSDDCEKYGISQGEVDNPFGSPIDSYKPDVTVKRKKEPEVTLDDFIKEKDEIVEVTAEELMG